MVSAAGYSGIDSTSTTAYDMDRLTLVDVLHTFVRSDGGPDITRRREQLQNLLVEFLPSEVRLLKDYLRDATFIRDFIPELPAEIIILVSPYLDLSDLLTVRRVSRQWCETWTGLSISNKLMKDYFRSHFENDYGQLQDSLKPAAFVAAADRLHAMQNGEYHTMRILRYHEAPGDSTPPLDQQYCMGKVAWSIQGGIQVTLLSTGVAHFFMTPDRENVKDWTLSEHIVVAGTGPTSGGAQLHAWFLEGDRNVITVRLPSLPSHNLAISGKRVAIVCAGKEVLIWTVGSSLSQMKITDPMPKHKGFRKIAVLFHPDCAQITFVIFLSCKKVEEDSEVTGTVRWTVQKYVDGVLQNMHALEYPLEGLDYRRGDEPGDSFSLSIRKTDENGNWSLGPVPVDFASRFLDLGCDHHWDRWYRRRDHRQRGHRHLAHYIMFNVYEERLSTLYYHMPGGNKEPEDINFVTPQEGDRPILTSSHIWSGQLFLPIVQLLDPRPLMKEPRWRLPVSSALVMAIKSCHQISGPPTPVRYIAGYNNMETWTTDGRFSTRDLGLNYCWAGDPHIARLAPTAVNANGEDPLGNFRQIQGDGTFVVLFGQYDYVVWCYDRTIRMPDPE